MNEQELQQIVWCYHQLGLIVEDNNAKTDAVVARQQLNTTNYILWFAPVSESDSLSDSDISFIKFLRDDLHISIICSKANRRTMEQREQIKQTIVMGLDGFDKHESDFDFAEDGKAFVAEIDKALAYLREFDTYEDLAKKMEG